jgi:hypothetical protein
MDHAFNGINSTFVDLTTDQNIAGNKIFEKDVVINRRCCWKRKI